MIVINPSIFLEHRAKICKELHRAAKTTFFCGAGVSTGSGIPVSSTRRGATHVRLNIVHRLSTTQDFRSSNGLYARTYEHNGTSLAGGDLFNKSTLENLDKIALLNMVLTDLRIRCRGAPTTAFHRLVSALHYRGRLQRCYTQNFDGLQTRDYPDLATMVCELHGSNQRTRCQICHSVCNLPIDTMDEAFLETGLVQCPACEAAGKWLLCC